MEITHLAAPQDIRETGLRRGFLEDLAVKTLFLNGEVSLVELADHMCLSLGIVEEVFQYLRREHLCEVKGMSPLGSHRIVASAQGKTRATELLALNQYAGPAPVPLETYSIRVRTQSIQQTEINPENLVRAFSGIVVDEDIVARIGAAVVSGTSLFLHGPSGTGKTSLTERIPAIFDDAVWIPHAVEVDNQVIAVYDPGVHRPINKSFPEEFDKRWVLCHRPRVIAGGELSLDMLDLQISAGSRPFTAPLQMKANNGVLVIDDLGRQRISPSELLNRWMTPLDRRVDFLTLPGGRKFEIPFDVFVVFATNLDPSELIDQAFLRRIPNKIRLGYATPEQFEEIFRKAAEALLLDYDDAVVDRLIALITGVFKQPLRPCYARDILQQVFWTAAYRKEELRVSEKIIEAACRNYFLPPAKS